MRRNHLTVERFPGVRFNQLQRSLVQLRVIISYQLSYTTYIYYIRHHLIIIIYNIIILKTIITTCKISCSPLAQTPATSPPSRSLLDKSTMHLGISSHHLHPNHPHHNLTIHKVFPKGIRALGFESCVFAKGKLKKKMFVAPVMYKKHLMVV